MLEAGHAHPVAGIGARAGDEAGSLLGIGHLLGMLLLPQGSNITEGDGVAVAVLGRHAAQAVGPFLLAQRTVVSGAAIVQIAAEPADAVVLAAMRPGDERRDRDGCGVLTSEERR